MDLSLLVGALLLGFMEVVQESLATHLSVAGAAPSLVLVTVVSWGLLRSPVEGFAWSLAGGIYLDLFSGLPFGSSAVALVLVTGLLHGIRPRLRGESLLLPLVGAFAGTTLYYALALFLVASVDHQLAVTPDSVKVMTGVLASNVAVSPLIFKACAALAGRLDPMPRATW